MNTLIHVQKAQKKYKRFQFGPVDFKAEKGTVIGLVGPNGSGKSTLLKLIMSLIHADQGSVHLFGDAGQGNEVQTKQKIAFAGSGLLQVIGDQSIRALAELVAYWYPAWDHATYQSLIHKYEIDEEQKYVKASTGQQKKVEFIFALATQAELLLLDEHSAGVDMLSQRKMKADLNQFMENGEHCVVMATHILDDVKHVCDKICVMDKGKIIQAFDKDEMHERWARLWVSGHIPETIRQQPFFIKYIDPPGQIITSNAQEMEKLLQAERLSVTMDDRLEMDEVLSYLIDQYE